MKFHKKGLLSLALSSLTFLSSCGASSILAMKETDSVQKKCSENEQFDKVDEFMVGVLLFPFYVTNSIISVFYEIPYAILIEKPRYLEHLKNISCSELSEPKYIKEQEGDAWCWIATIQGILKKLKPDLDLSQEDIYSATHDGKRPWSLKFLRLNFLRPGNHQDLLNNVLQKLNNPNLHPFCVVNLNGCKDKDNEKLIKLLINTFGPCFGIADPVRWSLTELGHVVMLSDYNQDKEILTFEDPALVKSYSIKLDKFAKLCESSFNMALDTENIFNDFGMPIFFVIGFTNDPNKSNCYEVEFDGKNPKLVENYGL